MKRRSDISNPGSMDGFAMVLTLLVVLVVGALVTGAVLVGGNHVLANRAYERTNQLDIVGSVPRFV